MIYSTHHTSCIINDAHLPSKGEDTKCFATGFAKQNMKNSLSN